MASNSVLNCMVVIIVGLTTVKAKSTSLSYTITCDPNSQTDCQNETLDTILNGIEGDYDVYIDLKITELQLNEVINLTGLKSLTIIGKLDVQTNIVCTPGQNASAGPGVVLRNVSESVELSNLNLIFCGSEIDTEFNGKIYIAAVTIIHCRNVYLSDITIEWSRGIGLMIVNHLGGEVCIESSIFRENNLHSDYYNGSASDFQAQGGGGVFIVQQSYYLSTSTVTVTWLQFQNCTFENNIANTSRYDHLYTNVQGKAREGYGRGGGVYVLFSNDIANVTVLFLSCKFIGNQAFIGSGLAVRIQGEQSKETTGIQVTILNSIFRRNGCDDNKTIEQGIGGGAHLTFDSYWIKSNNIINCRYTLENVRFIENCAELGGGVNHISGKRNIGDELNSNHITFDNCSFEGNKAHMGSAIFFATSIDRRLSSGHSTVIKFFDCLLTNNTVLPAKSSLLLSQITNGVGTIYVSSYNIHFNGDTIFTENIGSALYVINGVVNFQNSSALFENNKALQGGALALIGSSIFIVGPNRRYEFTGNSAIYKGGAIYVSQINSMDFISSDICFIQCIDENNSIISWDWNNTIVFTGNHAKDATAGHTIYATSLHPCQSVYNLTATESALYTLVSASEVFNERGIKFNEGCQNSEPQIATAGAVLLTNKLAINKFAIIPGERYEHNVTVIDDLNQTINASFWTVFKPTKRDEKIDISLASYFSTVITDTINIRGKPRQKAMIYMNLVSARQTFIRLNMEVLDCPPGFKLKDESKCVCNTNAYVGMFDCDLDKFQSHLISGYWAGYIDYSRNTSKLVTSACPFCDYNLSKSSMTTSDFDVILPRNHSELDESICGVTRTGTVCGKCRDGYTVHFHSPGFLCKPAEPVGCKLGWLFYILSELVPVTVVFITVLVLNISFTSGAVNGFILFSQLLASLDLTAGGIITFQLEALKNASQGYQIFYGFFNLDNFNSESLSFCLWKRASALDMLAIKYITILYTALLIITFVLIMNKCGGRCLGKCCRITTIKASVVHGISSFLMIGYSQCVNVSLRLLLQVHVYASRDDGFQPRSRVWFNGEIVHFSKDHLPYALPAVFCLLTVGVLPPLLLLIYPLLNKIVNKLGLEDFKFISCILKIPSTSSIKPFLDSFQGCFKDNMRFFAGLYFLYRWMFLLIHISTVGFFEHYTTIGGMLVFILTLHAIFQPYVKPVHNIIDVLLLCNLVFISSLSLFNFYRSTSPKIPNNTIIRSSTVQMVLIYLPALVMTGILLIHFCKYVYRCLCKNQANTKSVFIPNRARKLKDLVRTITSLNESSDEDFTHDQLMDEDVEFRATCDYVEGRDCPQQDTYN